MSNFGSSVDREPADQGRSALGFADAARKMAAQPTVAATMQRIVDVAVDTVDGCDGAGILLIGRREILVGAWSDERIHRVEMLENELAEGPCLDAIWEQPVFESADLHDHLGDWPRFARAALDEGIASMLGFRLFVDGDTLGALNLYGYRPGAFDETSRGIGSALAAHGALALSGSQTHASDVDTIAGLREALNTRDIIGQAKGILMATHKVDAEAAFAMLTKRSQERNIRLRIIAEEVTRTGTLAQR